MRSKVSQLFEYSLLEQRWQSAVLDDANIRHWAAACSDNNDRMLLVGGVDDQRYVRCMLTYSHTRMHFHAHSHALDDASIRHWTAACSDNNNRVLLVCGVDDQRCVCCILAYSRKHMHAYTSARAHAHVREFALFMSLPRATAHFLVRK